MKIGVITIHNYHNYGNRLQNYALHHILSNHFHCKVENLYALSEKPSLTTAFHPILKDMAVVPVRLLPALHSSRPGCKLLRWFNFRDWCNKLTRTRSFLTILSSPKALSDQYDCFFAGSDQIWNYNFFDSGYDDFFLRFAEDRKKAAISGSFGVESIPDEWKQTYIDGLSGFAHLSVREQAGQRIIKDLLGRDVPVLIDPTMALTKEEWKAVARKPRVDVSKPYVLKYYLGDESGEDSIDRWARENGYEVYPLLDPSRPELYSAGPGEFISLIENAALVCSDSFHCCVFSILFERPFAIYARKGKESNMTSRLDTLLGTFALEDRWIHKLSPKEYLRCDYTHIGPILQRERARFMDYIRTVLEDAHA